MGKALRKYNIPRSKVVLMTKCYRVVCDPENLDVGSGVAMLQEHASQSKDYVNNWGKKDLLCILWYDQAASMIRVTECMLVVKRFIEKCNI
jgi:aryl-alcohol dehydrogenase-like predicted oxidoreductase